MISTDINENMLSEANLESLSKSKSMFHSKWLAIK